MKIDPKTIKLKNGQTVTLRSPKPQDAKALLRNIKAVSHESYRNLNHPAQGWDNFPVSKEKKILAEFELSRSKFMLSAFFQDKIVGNLAVFGSTGDFFKHNARLAMGIEKSFCGAGLGSALIKLALAQCKRAKLHRVELTVRSHNKAGISLYKKMGFKKVGLLKDAAYIDGKYCDEYMYQILL